MRVPVLGQAQESEESMSETTLPITEAKLAGWLATKEGLVGSARRRAAFLAVGKKAREYCAASPAWSEKWLRRLSFSRLREIVKRSCTVRQPDSSGRDYAYSRGQRAIRELERRKRSKKSGLLDYGIYLKLDDEGGK